MPVNEIKTETLTLSDVLHGHPWMKLVTPLQLADPFQDAAPCFARKRYHLMDSHRRFICTCMSTETAVKLMYPCSIIEHAELDADVIILSPKTETR